MYCLLTSGDPGSVPIWDGHEKWAWGSSLHPHLCSVQSQLYHLAWLMRAIYGSLLGEGRESVGGVTWNKSEGANLWRPSPGFWCLSILISLENLKCMCVNVCVWACLHSCSHTCRISYRKRWRTEIIKPKQWCLKILLFYIMYQAWHPPNLPHCLRENRTGRKEPSHLMAQLSSNWKGRDPPGLVFMAPCADAMAMPLRQWRLFKRMTSQEVQAKALQMGHE